MYGVVDAKCYFKVCIMFDRCCVWAVYRGFVKLIVSSMAYNP